MWGSTGRGTYQPAQAAEPAASIGTEATGAGNNTTTRNNSVRVDRNTSIRSIMTLPPYRLDPTNTEQVIAREGERDGVDVVVEMPTEESLETLREEEMESLYQMRLARRQQLDEREQRREARREARGRNDMVALETLRSSRNNGGVDRSALREMRREHDRIKNQRRGAVSSVSYADIGVAHHDGSRIRANSAESERTGLLDGAAGMAVAGPSGERRPSTHARMGSESTMSVNTEFPPPSLQRSRASSRAESARLSTYTTRRESGVDWGEADVGEEIIPPHSPPGYEDADHGRSTTPAGEPPPGYPGRNTSPEQAPSAQRSSGEREGSGESVRDSGEGGDRRASRMGVDGTPQLPSLRLGGVPRIVIEPSQERTSETREPSQEQTSEAHEPSQEQASGAHRTSQEQASASHE